MVFARKVGDADVEHLEQHLTLKYADLLDAH
jgi:hypothetical protein